MARNTIKTQVKDGWVSRDASSGLLEAVRTSKGTHKVTGKTKYVLKEVSSKRNSALKRLADR